MKTALHSLLFLLLAFSVAGCSQKSSTTTAAVSSVSGSATAPQVILVGVDRSESTAKFRGQMLNQLDLTADVAASNKALLKVWAFDRAPLQLYSGLPKSHDDLSGIKRKQLAPDQNHPRTITRPALLLEAWIQDRKLHPADATDAVILSDGDSEVYTDRSRFVAAIKTLGVDPNFRLALVGINPEDRTLWDGALAPAMPGRYLLTDEQNGQAELAHFLQGRNLP